MKAWLTSTVMVLSLSGVARAQLMPGIDQAFNGGFSSPSREAPRVLQSFIDSSFLTDVASPTVLTGLSFRLPAIASSDPMFTAYPTADITFTQYSITLAQPSAAAAAANGLTSNTFADNMSDPVVVRSGSLTIPAGSFTDNNTGPGVDPAGEENAEFSYFIPFSVPYTLEPGDDLVVLLRHNGYGAPQQTSWNFDAFAYTNGGRVATGDVNAASANNAVGDNVVMKYAFSIIPEPSGVALLTAGLLLALRRRRG